MITQKLFALTRVDGGDYDIVYEFGSYYRLLEYLIGSDGENLKNLKAMNENFEIVKDAKFCLMQGDLHMWNLETRHWDRMSLAFPVRKYFLYLDKK